VILAAGRGTRLKSLTSNRSKAMLPVAGKPITERVMEQLTARDVDEFILVHSPEDKEFEQYFSQIPDDFPRIRLVHQPEPLGSAHALSCAAPLIRGDFILSACDNLTSRAYIQNMLSTWKGDSELNGLLSIMPVEQARMSQVGFVVMEGSWIERIVEKPPPPQAPSDVSSLPLYIFNPRILDHLQHVQLSERGEYEMPDAIQMLIDQDRDVRGIAVDHRLTLTNPQDLININKTYLAEDRSLLRVNAKNIGPNTKLIPPVFIESGTIVGTDCRIGPSVYIEENCRIGNHVQITNAVVLRGSSVRDNTDAINQVISLDWRCDVS
jgi:glucose-1-phosphate thymidylyltransferase